MNFMDDIKEQLLKKEFEYDAVDADHGKMDRNASAIIGALENSGYEAYAVGGCVRDLLRSEERRVGKECRSRWSPYH